MRSTIPNPYWESENHRYTGTHIGTWHRNGLTGQTFFFFLK